ncbi:MAG: NosD domain-containing protein [Promethearchaeota archaeon]|jgi:parallel beta-helix repeat protein
MKTKRKKNSKVGTLSILFIIMFFSSSVMLLNLPMSLDLFTTSEETSYKGEYNISSQGEDIFKLIYGTDAGPANLDPQNSIRSNSFDVINQVCEGLFTYNLTDPNFSIIPNLAVSKGSWLVNLTDTWYTISLRPNVSFHDGTKFNATAVKFTFDRLAYLINNSMAIANYLYEYYDPDTEVTYPIINETVIIDEYTIRFELNKPYGPFEALLCFPASYILSPTSTPQFNLIDTITGDLVGTGPFVFDHYLPDEEVLFHAFEDYWAGRANITILKFAVISDPSVTYEKTYSFTTRNEANDGTWDYWNTDIGGHQVEPKGSYQYWCWTDSGTDSVDTGPPSNIACIYPETSSPTSVGDIYIATLADSEEIDTNVYDLYVTFNTIMQGDPAGHMYFEYWDGDSWEIKDDWQGDTVSTFTAQGPYDFTALTNSDFKIRFRVVVGGVAYRNDFTFDEVRIFTGSKEEEVDIITDPYDSRFSTFIADPDVTLNDAGQDAIAQFLSMNNNKVNATFRKAISYAINYSNIINELQVSPADRLKSPLIEDLLFANWSYDVAIYNVTKAREIMQNMGFGIGWDTTFPGTTEVNWASASFASFNYSYYFGDTFRQSLLFLLQDNLDKIGIEIIDAGMSYTEFDNILYQKNGYTWDMWELCWLGWYNDYNDPDNILNSLFTNRTTSFNTAFYDGYLAATKSGRDPLNIWDNVQLLMEAALFETNQSLRKPYYDRIQQILVEEDMPWAYGIVSRNYDAYQSYIIGFQSNPLGKLNFYGVTQNSSREPQPIHLMGNQEWQYYRSANKCTGQGTPSDPYVIKDLVIDGNASENCILIENSDVYFTIDNCTLYNGGIKLNNVSYGQLSDNNINNNSLSGINLIHSQYINITRNNASYNNNDGVKLQYSDHNIIVNNTANNNDYGLYIANSNNNTISDNIAKHNNMEGIYLFYSNNSEIIGNNASDNINNGIYLESFSVYNNITGNIVYNNYYGILFRSSDNNTIEDNKIEYNVWSGIYLYYSDLNNISRNNLINNVDNGIYFYYSGSNNILGNNLSNNVDSGIYFYSSDYNNILGNNVTNNLEQGIYLYNSDYNDVLDNNVTNNRYNGFFLSDSDYNNISGNNITNNTYNGINLDYSHYNDILGNNVTNNEYNGIILYYSDYNEILGNNITNNDDGISLSYSDRNTILGNSISFHYYGIYLYNSYLNQITNNFFNNNTEDIREVFYTYYPPPQGPNSNIIILAVAIAIIIICIILGCILKSASSYNQRNVTYRRKEVYKKIPPRNIEIPYKKESTVSRVTPQGKVREIKYRPKEKIVEDSIKHCTHCGQRLTIKAKFCINCGKSVEKDQVSLIQSEEKSPQKTDTNKLPPKFEEVPSIPAISEKKEEKIRTETLQIKPKEIQQTPPISEEVESKQKEIPGFCEFCGMELNKGSIFCPQCGARKNKK